MDNKKNYRKLILKPIIFVLVCIINLSINQVLADEPVLRLVSAEPSDSIKIISSVNGKYKAHVTYTKSFYDGRLIIDEVTLKDLNGNVIWQNDSLKYNCISVTNDGSVICISHSGCLLEYVYLSFFNQKGKLIRNREYYSADHHSLTPDGKYLMLRIRETILKAKLLTFNSKGEIIQNFGWCDNFAVTAGLKTVVVAYDKELRVYKNGKPVWMREIDKTIDLSFGQSVAISPDDQFIALLSRKKMYLFESTNVVPLWIIDVEKGTSFNTVSMSKQADRIVVGLNCRDEKTGRDTSGYIYVFDGNGTKLTEQRIYTIAQHEYMWIKQIDVSEDGKLIIVTTLKDKYKFKLME